MKTIDVKTGINQSNKKPYIAVFLNEIVLQEFYNKKAAIQFILSLRNALWEETEYSENTKKVLERYDFSQGIKAIEKLTLGRKTDHRKIDIFVKDGKDYYEYRCSTTWSKTCKEAKANFLKATKNKDLNEDQIKTNYCKQ